VRLPASKAEKMNLNYQISGLPKQAILNEKIKFTIELTDGNTKKPLYPTIQVTRDNQQIRLKSIVSSPAQGVSHYSFFTQKEGDYKLEVQVNQQIVAEHVVVVVSPV